jgi:hypothetical protein
LAGALLAGCGSNDDDGGGSGQPSPTGPVDNGVSALAGNEIVNKAVAALSTVGSYRLSGEMTEGGETFKLDIKVSGGDVLGSITLGGATVELLGVDGQQFIRPDATFWKDVAGDDTGTMAQLLGDRWAKVGAGDEEFADFFTIADAKELLTPDGSLTKGDPKTIAGVSAIGIVDGSADGGTLYVATTGEPYPLLMEGPAGEGQLVFSDFGATFDDIKAPAASEFVDLDKLLEE